MAEYDDPLERDLLDELAAIADLHDLEQYRISVLGKKGRLTAEMKTLGGLDPEARKEKGQHLNRIKSHLELRMAEKKTDLEAAEMDVRLRQETLDLSLSPRPVLAGRIHPVSQVMDEIAEIFAALGFAVAEGPDIEDDFHNFSALNIPPEHPARQMHDTFYLPAVKGAGGEDGASPVLRTHTSPVQVRTMKGQAPPIRIVAPGRTYRSDSDATHTPMFHQVEGLVIDKTTHLGHLKGVIVEFCRAFFEIDDVKMRLRSSYFPFTEPSVEVDIQCSFEGGSLKFGEGDDWLEILGSGLVHPKVLENCGLDPAVYQGYAFGMGVDRLAMLKYGIPDLRAFFDSDLRWLRHYGFSVFDVPTVGGGLAR